MQKEVEYAIHILMADEYKAFIHNDCQIVIKDEITDHKIKIIKYWEEDLICDIILSRIHLESILSRIISYPNKEDKIKLQMLDNQGKIITFDYCKYWRDVKDKIEEERINKRGKINRKYICSILLGIIIIIYLLIKVSNA